MSYNPESPKHPEIAIHVESMGKMYTLYNQPLDRLKHTLFWRLGKDYGHPFWALKDVTFKIVQGETFGIIGRNGSGKSTLLQILAGILRSTNGSVVVNGRVAPLLELGSGFNLEFTGRENIRLNGMILGLTGIEIEDKTEEIIAFADIGEFIDQPVKFYSSGMFVRLAFAVAASIEADILLIDEILAVGDIFFRQKCYRRLEQLRNQGATIVLVSHALNEVEQFCNRALLLNEGKVEYIGTAIETVKHYYLQQQAKILDKLDIKKQSVELENKQSFAQDQIEWPSAEAMIDISGLTQISQGTARCTAVAITDQEGKPCRAFQQGQLACFFFEFETLQDIEVPIGGTEIINEKGIIVHGKNSLLDGTPAPSRVMKGHRVRFHQNIGLQVHTGEYTFNVGFSTIAKQDFEARSKMTHADMDAKISVLNILPNAGQFAVLPRLEADPVRLTHFGVANLPGKLWMQIVYPTKNGLEKK